MISTIDMKEMRQLNLFSRVTGINTRHCFPYNNMIVFSVPQKFVLKAIGEDSKNLKKLSDVFGKRVRVVPIPFKEEDAEKFIEKIVSPVEFKGVEVKDDEIVLTAGSRNKAALIGRNKRRLLEMQRIVKDFFRKEFRIV